MTEPLPSSIPDARSLRETDALAQMAYEAVKATLEAREPEERQVVSERNLLAQYIQTFQPPLPLRQ